MSNSSPYAFLDQVSQKDTNLLNYYLDNNKYENCPKNNVLMHIDIDNILKKEHKYIDQSLINYKNTYQIKKN